MDRATILRHLAMAERHVAEGEGRLAKQVALILKMERLGHDSADARTILETLRWTQANHIHDRDRILRELEARPAD